MQTFNDIISFAINMEKESVDLYEKMSKLAIKPNVKAMFDDFAEEELKHVEILTNINYDNLKSLTPSKAIDLKISDYLIDIEFKDDINYQDALIFAMKREERAVKLYEDMLKKISDTELAKLVDFLIKEEAKHKLRLETEYDDRVLAEC